ncbi:MAG TPA: hypothetical protein VE011_10435 [Candidatus Dormibacteraeota bacterium]|nr:hypothetical protein [Candidatus Dormibacteraeota bacterium]
MSATADPFDGSELDFWLGEWNVAWDGGHGTNRLERILGGAVIHERFEETDDDSGGVALRGESWSVFDAARAVWRQTWVDNQGGYLDLVGERVDGCFGFVRRAPEAGDGARQQMVFRDVEPDTFRWTWELSLDDGATWSIRWEITYRRA